MKIKVEQAYAGHDSHYHLLTLPDGSRECVPGFRWTRKTASVALDLLEQAHGIDRARVRFDHQ